MKPLFLGVDVGTSKVKAVLFDEFGNEIQIGRSSSFGQEIISENASQDMNVLWNTVSRVIRQAIKGVNSIGEIMSIGVTAQGGGLWLLDDNGNPVDDAILWIDGRARSYIRKWEREGIVHSSGRTVYSGSPLAFSAWSYENDPIRMSSAKSLIFCKDWIKYRLTGVISTDITDLSDVSIIDVWSKQYSKNHLKKFGTEELFSILPQIEKSIEIVGTVTEEASKVTGLDIGIPVVNGMIDVAATAIGNGIIEPLSACSIVGTTLFNEMAINDIGTSSSKEKHSSSLICYLDDIWLMNMGTMTGTPNLDWYIKEFYPEKNSFNFDQMEYELEKNVNPGSGGVIFHPYIGQGGERAPFIQPNATAQFFGIKSCHTREHLLRALYEGIAFSMRDCYRYFDKKPNYIRIAGGGSASKFWCQMFSDCTGFPVQVTSGYEIGAKGVAILAAVGSGHFSSIKEGISQMVRIKAEYLPNLENKKIYDNNFEIYVNLYKNIWDLWDERAKYW